MPAKNRTGLLFGLIVSSAAAAFAAAGCSKGEDKAARDGKGATPGDQSAIVVDGKKAGGAKGVPALVPFKEAVLLEPPEDLNIRPPDKTVTGKSVAKLYERIVGKEGVGGLWEQVAFVTPDNKRIRYTARIVTDAGEIEMELLDDAAPNHVRNFVALARAGYYDGLRFERSTTVNLGDRTLAMISGGCPRGIGNVGEGSIGYWLKPEVAPQIRHDEGMVGAWRHPDYPDSAGCRFYIMLTKAEGMDGQYTLFAKVTKGLDVAHTINKRPNQAEEDRPLNPVVIRSVTIHPAPAESAIARN